MFGSIDLLMLFKLKLEEIKLLLIFLNVIFIVFDRLRILISMFKQFLLDFNINIINIARFGFSMGISKHELRILYLANLPSS